MIETSSSHVPARGRLEITVRVVALGLVRSVVMGAANVNVGLKSRNDGVRPDSRRRHGHAAVQRVLRS